VAVTLRMLTYNIKTGGQDRADDRRLEQVIRVIDGQRPDVLALQELRDFTRRGRLQRVAEAVGMRAFLARSAFGQPVAVFVRPPGRLVQATPIRRPFHHAAARVVVDTDRGPLTIIGTHLNPYSGTWRLREARWLIGQARSRADDPMAVLMGDLNSLDPWSDHAERIRRLPERHRGRHVLAGNPVAVDTRVLAALARAGFVDLFRHAGSGKDYTAPTALGGDEFSGMRLDYILGTSSVAGLTRGCRVVDGGETELASDHYPVLAEIDLDWP
jgi:exodeoxyribonuclease III